MGFFDSFTSAVSSVAKKAVKGVKSGATKAFKGAKSGVGRVVKGAKAQGLNKNFGRNLQRGLVQSGKLLQAPQKYIRENDPIAKKMGSFGDFSPISFGASLALAPATTSGFLQELAGSKKKQQKLKSGDVDTITDLTLAPLSFLPAGALGKGAKVGSRLGKRGVKALSRFI